MTKIIITEKIKTFIEKKDKILNKNRWEENALSYNFERLIKFNSVEIGWRNACGQTDHTVKVYREWLKLVKLLEKDQGIILKQENIKHPNKSPTMAQGFWNSIIYSI